MGALHRPRIFEFDRDRGPVSRPRLSNVVFFLSSRKCIAISGACVEALERLGVTFRNSREVRLSMRSVNTASRRRRRRRGDSRPSFENYLRESFACGRDKRIGCSSRGSQMGRAHDLSSREDRITDSMQLRQRVVLTIDSRDH